MNKLKFFESYTESANPKWQSIEYSYWSRLYDNSSKRQFTQKNLETIKSHFDENKWMFIEKEDKHDAWFINRENMNRRKFQEIDVVRLYKIDDDYYLASTHSPKYMKQQFYLCDEFDGLVEFLKNLPLS